MQNEGECEFGLENDVDEKVLTKIIKSINIHAIMVHDKMVHHSIIRHEMVCHTIVRHDASQNGTSQNVNHYYYITNSE